MLYDTLAGRIPLHYGLIRPIPSLNSEGPRSFVVALFKCFWRQCQSRCTSRKESRSASRHESRSLISVCASLARARSNCSLTSIHLHWRPLLVQTFSSGNNFLIVPVALVTYTGLISSADFLSKISTHSIRAAGNYLKLR